MDKTIQKIKYRFFWTNLSIDVKNFVKKCFECQKVKLLKTYCKPKLMPLETTITLMIITMDMGSPLPETPRGNKHILTIYNHYKKYVKVFPMMG